MLMLFAAAAPGSVRATPVLAPAVLSNGRKKCWLPAATMVDVPSCMDGRPVFWL